MRLIIAEKHSVASEIAPLIGATGRRDGYYAGENDLVTWCVGHLIELSPMDSYDARFTQWRAEYLPFIPKQFKYRVSDRTRDQFNVIKSLFDRSDITSVVNACDAGREGELIFSLIYDSIGRKLPVERLWLQALTTNSILTAFASLRPASEFQGLRSAAYARQRADWIVGMNATRAQTIVARAQGGDGVKSLGRVQTPTLALVVNRDLAIENFRPSTFYEIKATFMLPDSQVYDGWLFKGPNPTGAVITRFDRREGATAFSQRLAACPNPALVVAVSRKEIKAHPPFLYDLTLLQRVADRRLGLTPTRTLEIAQSLYEKKHITYPRTSSQYLTTDDAATVNEILYPLSKSKYCDYAQAILASGWKLTSRHVADKKVTDHPALIPTSNVPAPEALTNEEASVYELIVRRFLAAFHPDAVDARTEVVTVLDGEYFVTRGTVELYSGWRVVDPPAADKNETRAEDELDSGRLPQIEPNSHVHASVVTPVEKQTRAPERYTPDTLLSAMKTAGTQFKDADEYAAMKDMGLGTSATRGGIIDKLFERNYCVAEGKRFIRATPLGREIITRLQNCNSVLASAALTGQWETALVQMEAGEFEPDKFNALVAQMTVETVKQIFAQQASGAGGPHSFAAVEGQARCPNCQAAARDNGFLILRTSRPAVEAGKASTEPKRGAATQGQKFYACSQPRDVCGYTTAVPQNKTQAKAIVSFKCPTCSGVMRLTHGKEKGTPFMVCFKSGCKGVKWFDDGKKKTGGKKAASKRSLAKV